MTGTILEDRVAKLDAISLQHGAHNAAEDGMCAMEAVAWIAGEPHSDHPQCASPAISAFMRSWNDGLSDADRDRLLKPYLVRLVGSRGSVEQEGLRGRLALDWHNGVMLPAFLDLVEELRPHAVAVRADHLNGDVVRAAWDAAEDAAEDAVSSAPGSAALNAAAWDAAWSAAWNAAKSAAWNAALDAASDAALNALQVSALDAARSAALNAARSAALNAAGDALAPTVAALQVSALDLLERMLAVTETETA